MAKFISNNMLLATGVSLMLSATSMPAVAEPMPAGLDTATLTRELSLHPDDPTLNFLSGLAYERAATASTEARELARVGYLMALRQDSGFWRASYQLGLMALEDRDPYAAQRYLLVAAQNAPREARVFSALARASYCAGDLATAAAALSRAATPGAPATSDDALTAALLAAEQGDKHGVDELAGGLPALQREAVISRLASPRLRQDAAKPVQGADAAPSASQRRMAVVDVVVIRRSEKSGRSSGINLLDSLTLQFGSSLINSNWARSTDHLNPGLSTNVTSASSTAQLTIPAVTWSLNLANAAGAASRIEARPTLLVHDGEEAKVFDGGSLTYATDGQLSSSSYTRDVGLSLSVKPKFIDNDHVSLGVSVVLETFVPSQPVGTFHQAIQTEKSSTDVSADMRFGQTMLVSSGISTSIGYNHSQTPVAGQIPLIGKLFSARARSQQDNALLVLLTLRPVPGQDATPQAPEDSAQIADLARSVLGDIAGAARLARETRQLPYRLDNPARVSAAGYLDPLFADLKDRHLAAARHN